MACKGQFRKGANITAPFRAKGYVMFCKVKVNKEALNYFRKLARENYPNEIQAYLLGTIASIDTIEILEFKYPKKYSIQSPTEVNWSDEDYREMYQYAHENNLTVVGDCHSHPNWDAVMSGADYRSSIFASLIICGIVSVYDRKTRVRFWTPNSALPCKIIYT